MNKDIEKIKSKIDQVVGLYVEKDNSLLQIPEDKIYMKFSIDDQDYVAFTDDSFDTEEINMMFAKIDYIDDKRILKSIVLEDEYERVVNVFNEILGFVEN